MEDLHYKDKKLEFCGEYDQWKKKTVIYQKLEKNSVKMIFAS